MSVVVAVDGAAGSGKSSVSKGVAERLGLAYLDTGAMYRAMTLWMLRNGVDTSDAEAVAAHVERPELTIGTDPRQPQVEVDGEDAVAAIRTPEVTSAVSAVSAVPEVRERLVQVQRDIARSAANGAIVEGRDIGTVVFPDADLKLFLAADHEVRAKRRAAEDRDRGHAADEAGTAAALASRDAADSSRSVGPLAQAADAVVVDGTHDDLPTVIDRVVALVRDAGGSAVAGAPVDVDGSSAEDDPDAADASKDTDGSSAPDGADVDFDDADAFGDEYLDFADDDDPEVLLGIDPDVDFERPIDVADSRPVVAVVGRPNVGKSSLVNRILRRREAVVEDVPGVTRDRVSYDAEWAGREFVLVDTGGWDTKVRGLAASVAAQAERAMNSADVVVLVVDATVGATDVDDAVVPVLRRAGVPVILVANKCDDARAELEAAALWSMGLGEPYPVSALHGRGSGDFLDALVDAMPDVGRAGALVEGPPRVALLGKPNVGKSSLLNQLAGSDRAVVDAKAGTTVDPVDEVVDLAGTQWLFIDTAGIRRRVREASGQEYYASLRTHTAVDRAEVVAVLMDASEPLTEQDTRLVSSVVEAGRALVLVMNKWDLVDEERRRYLDREYDRDLSRMHWAPRVNISALTGWHTDRLTAALETSLTSWHQRVPTGQLNQFLREIVDAHPHPLRGGKQPRILFGTQASTAPPEFVLFTTGFLEAGYRRFIERRLREDFGFEGSPIQIRLRIREKRRRR